MGVTYSEPYKNRLHNLPRTDLVDRITRLQIQLDRTYDDSDRRLALLRRSRQMIQRGKNHMTRLDEFDPELIDELVEELGDGCELAEELKDE